MDKKLKRFVVEVICTEYFGNYEINKYDVKDAVENYLEELKLQEGIVSYESVAAYDSEKEITNYAEEQIEVMEQLLEERDKAINSLATISRNQFNILSFIDEKITQMIQQEERKDLFYQDSELLYFVAGLKGILKNMDKNADDMQYVLENHHIVINEDDEFLY